MTDHNKLLSRFKQIRADFLETIVAFPSNKREKTLFSNWNLKQVLDHIQAWDEDTLRIIKLVENGDEPEHAGSLDEFNANSIKKRNKWDWEKSCEMFIETGDILTKEYGNLSEELWEKTFWKNKTLSKILKQVCTSHYNHHLKRIKAYLKS